MCQCERRRISRDLRVMRVRESSLHYENVLTRSRPVIRPVRAVALLSSAVALRSRSRCRPAFFLRVAQIRECRGLRVRTMTPLTQSGGIRMRRLASTQRTFTSPGPWPLSTKVVLGYGWVHDAWSRHCRTRGAETGETRQGKGDNCSGGNSFSTVHGSFLPLPLEPLRSRWDAHVTRRVQ